MQLVGLIQPPFLWALLGVIVIGISLAVASRLLSKTVDDTKPTVVGAVFLQRKGDLLGSPPLFTYVGDVGSRSGVIGVGLQGGPKTTTARILFTNVKSCEASGAVKLVSEPKLLGSDLALYSFHQGSTRKVYVVEVEVAANAHGGVSCNVTDYPERETYITRRVAFSPPLSKDILASVIEGGYVAIMPMMVNIQRVTGSTGFNTSGGKRVEDNAIGAITESSYLSADDIILRAFWNDEHARSRQTFWLFVLAAAAGTGFAMLIEAIHPLIDSLSHFAVP